MKKLIICVSSVLSLLILSFTAVLADTNQPFSCLVQAGTSSTAGYSAQIACLKQIIEAVNNPNYPLDPLYAQAAINRVDNYFNSTSIDTMDVKPSTKNALLMSPAQTEPYSLLPQTPISQPANAPIPTGFSN